MGKGIVEEVESYMEGKELNYEVNKDKRTREEDKEKNLLCQVPGV